MAGIEEIGNSLAGSLNKYRADYIEVRLEENDPAKATEQINDMCRKLLANPVIEHYRFDLEKL